MMRKPYMVLGSIYGYALLLNFSHRDLKGRRYGEYECIICGGVFRAREGHIKAGRIRSCGCFAKMNASKNSRKHGLRYHPLYHTYMDMLRRCTVEHSECYGDYGGRGITVCSRWLGEGGLKNFLADVGNRPEGYSLDRINNNMGYSPDNCRWASKEQQSNNTRISVKIEYKGEIKTISEWSRATGVSAATIGLRFKAGKKGEELFVKPKRRFPSKNPKTRLRSIWKGVKERCYVPTIKAYKNYGGRGIVVCDEWLNSFTIFYEWSIANGYSIELTLDRIDNNGNYCPENCKWTTLSEQQKNRRDTVFLTYKGKTMILKDWAIRLGVLPSTITGRIRRGLSEDKIFHVGRLKSKR